MNFCGLAAFANGPDDERLPTSHVASGEDAGNARHLFSVCGDVAALVDGDAEVIEHAVTFRTEETHREKHQILIDSEFGAWNFLEIAPFELDSNGVKWGNVAVATRVGQNILAMYAHV